MNYGRTANHRRQCDALGNVLLTFFDIDTTHFNIVADRVYSFSVKGSGLFQADNAPCHTAKIVQE